MVHTFGIYMLPNSSIRSNDHLFEFSYTNSFHSNVLLANILCNVVYSSLNKFRSLSYLTRLSSQIWGSSNYCYPAVNEAKKKKKTVKRSWKKYPETDKLRGFSLRRKIYLDVFISPISRRFITVHICWNRLLSSFNKEHLVIWKVKLDLHSVVA